MGQSEGGGRPGRDFQGQVVTGDDSVERFAGCTGDDALDGLGDFIELDVKPIGDCGYYGMMPLGRDDEPRTERGGGHLVSGNTITLMECDQKNPRGFFPTGWR